MCDRQDLFSDFNSISYTEDRHELRVTGKKCRLPDTGEIFILDDVTSKLRFSFLERGAGYILILSTSSVSIKSLS